MSRTIKRPYTKGKAVSVGCRCHGSCGYCLANRMYRDRRRKEKAEESLKEWKERRNEEKQTGDN